jgi:hypothetical protein
MGHCTWQLTHFYISHLLVFRIETRSVFFKVRVEAEDKINTLNTITSVIDCASPLLRYFEFYSVSIMNYCKSIA